MAKLIKIIKNRKYGTNYFESLSKYEMPFLNDESEYCLNIICFKHRKY